MKKFIFVAIILGAALGATLVYRHRNSTPRQSQDLAALEQELQRKHTEAEAERARSAALEGDLAAARIETARTEAKARSLAAALSTNNQNRETSATPPNPLKDPAMRKMMEKQQLQGLERNIKRLVNADLQARLNLDPDQAAQLRDLLKRKQLPAMEMLMASMSGELDQERATAMGARANQERNAADMGIRNLLGKEGYEYFDWHERSDPERERVRSFRSEFADAGEPLTKDQEEQLALTMYQERQNFKFAVDFEDPGAFDLTCFQDYFSEENLNRFFAEREQLNQQMLARVQTILTPEQLQEFGRLQQEHLEKGKNTVRMTQALFPMKKPNQSR